MLPLNHSQGQKGMALMLILALLLILLTSVIVANVSLNKGAQHRRMATQDTLKTVRDGLMAYALSDTHPIIVATNPMNQPPGTLPCPASDRLGMPGVSGGVCTSQRGLVPYRALGIAEPLDGSGAPLWYAVATNLTGNTSPPVSLRNSELMATLSVKFTSANRLDPVAFVVMAPGAALTGQTPITAPMASVSQFLEGVNAGANPLIYDDLNDASHNDTLLAMPLGLYWSTMEKRVLQEIAENITIYRNRCGLYPWAATFGGTGDSVNSKYEGGAPIGIALPTNWGGTCGANPALPVLASWLNAHWGKLLYYAICKAAAPNNPPLSPCLQVSGTSNSTAEVIMLAPGTTLTTTAPPQNRNQITPPNFFEGLNSDVTANTFTQLLPINHTGTFNDVLLIVR